MQKILEINEESLNRKNAGKSKDAGPISQEPAISIGLGILKGAVPSLY